VRIMQAILTVRQNRLMVMSCGQLRSFDRRQSLVCGGITLYSVGALDCSQQTSLMSMSNGLFVAHTIASAPL
jgi:hypothetical protein